LNKIFDFPGSQAPPHDPAAELRKKEPLTVEHMLEPFVPWPRIGTFVKYLFIHGLPAGICSLDVLGHDSDAGRFLPAKRRPISHSPTCCRLCRHSAERWLRLLCLFVAESNRRDPG
jgi:hypothetical protein